MQHLHQGRDETIARLGTARFFEGRSLAYAASLPGPGSPKPVRIRATGAASEERPSMTSTKPVSIATSVGSDGGSCPARARWTTRPRATGRWLSGAGETAGSAASTSAAGLQDACRMDASADGGWRDHPARHYDANSCSNASAPATTRGTLFCAPSLPRRSIQRAKLPGDNSRTSGSRRPNPSPRCAA